MTMPIMEEMNESREWLPRLIDIIHFAQEGTADEQLYFSRFGFSQLVIPADCTRVSARMTTLQQLFEQRYLFRRIGAETMPRWQIRLQNRMDTIVHRYERAYELYEDSLINEIQDGEIETHSGTDARNTTAQNSGQASGTSKVSDTPDSAVSENDAYAGSFTKNNTSNSTSGSSTDRLTHGEVIERMHVGPDILEGVNENIDGWRDLDVALVAEFENLFMNVFD